ncbi:MAG: glycosyltransferase family 2 protein [Desulfovibrio sp.]|uniref:glycosyltransferase family 2 protein n=1 Tax=Desulfovibrio sp. 7SRBS1 TaxID=3378064 RepID=UPI003B3EAB46
MSHPALSIIVPSYNMQPWLPAALESCLWQTRKDIEVIVVNDGSTDRTGEIADAYARADSRVKAIHQANQGSGKARQTGQDAANGEFLFWLDADDFLDADMARVMLETAERDKVDMVCGNAVVFSTTTFNTRRYFHHPAISRTTFANPRYWKSKVAWRWILRRSFVEERAYAHPPYKLGQDVCFMFEMLAHVDSFSQCPDFVYYFRQDHKSAAATLETEIDHQIAHFLEAKRILLGAGQIKPLIKYLNENYFRDIKVITPKLSGPEDPWFIRCRELSLQIFKGLDPAWFEADFLAPELSVNEDFLPMAHDLIAQDAEAVTNHMAAWHERGLKKHSVDKDSGFHTLRRRIKALFNPMSRGARCRLRELEKRAAQRMG